MRPLEPTPNLLAHIQRGVRRTARLSATARRREAFFRIARYFTPAVAVDCRGVRYFVSTEDRVIGLSLFTLGGFGDRLDEVFAVLAEMSEQSPRRGDTIVDVGANIGTTTIPALKAGYAAQAVAIEPHPDNVTLLRQNVAANGVADHVRVLGVALSDHIGEIHLAVSANNGGGHRVSIPESTAGGERRRESTMTVASTTLDALVAAGELDLGAVALLWIDAQGHEGHILAGAKALLESDVPVLAEYWPHGLRHARALERFEALIGQHYSHFVDMSQASSLAGAEPVSRLPDLRSRYGEETGSTDLLLLKL